MNMARTPAVLLAMLLACVTAAESAPGAGCGRTLTLAGPEGGAIDAPASVSLTVSAEELDAVRLIETTEGTETAIPSQVEPGTPPKLWWIARGALAAGARRTYRLERGAATSNTVVAVEQRRAAVTVRIGESPVLQYNIAHVEPPAELDARYGRNGYIHPCWTPSGAVVTEQFPADHAHQSGLFLAYVKTMFEGRAPDFWNLLGGTGSVRSTGVTRTADGPVFGEFEAVHEHVDESAMPERVALNESWTVRVWNLGGHDSGYWICDLTSRITCATDSPLRLPEYHYGGMALRGARDWGGDHAQFLTSEGHDRTAGNHTRPWWCDLSGPVGEATAGLLFMTHPSNFRAPEPLRMHPTMPYMVYAPSFLGEWEITPASPHVSRYRFVFHDGVLSADVANLLHRQFAAPLEAHVE